MNITPRFAGTLLIKANPYTTVPSTRNTLQTELSYRQMASAGEIGATELGDKGVLAVFPKDKTGKSKAVQSVQELASEVGAQTQYFPKDHAPLTDDKIAKYQGMV